MLIHFGVDGCNLTHTRAFRCNVTKKKLKASLAGIRVIDWTNHGRIDNHSSSGDIYRYRSPCNGKRFSVN
ncbi:hypothetical protein [Acetomicrobium sp.]|uniref:hypothetical protein n=1 Tax=Acetomicrobium sp. TaxID=1872099 RepID=UPI002FC63DBB